MESLNWLPFGLFGATILDTVLLATWNGYYFKFGFPLFLSEIPVRQTAQPFPTALELERAFSHPHSSFVPLVFRGGASDTLLFRERIWYFTLHLHYTSIMHGRVTFDVPRAMVRVTGLANWTPLAFQASAATLAYVTGETFARIFNLSMLAIFLASYAIHFARFRKVARVAAERWSGELRSPREKVPP